MNRFDSPQALAVLLALWLLACVAAYLSKSDLVMQFSYVVLPLSALLVPLAVGRVAYKVNRKSGSPVKDASKPWELAALGLASLSYLVCAVVLSRLLEIPWRQAKFGDPVLSLGYSAAQFFCLIAVSLASAAALLLYKTPKQSRPTAYASAALAMLGFACLAYAAIGVSPFAQWRA
jgi:uncharacterized membrane protein